MFLTIEQLEIQAEELNQLGLCANILKEQDWAYYWCRKPLLPGEKLCASCHQKNEEFLTEVEKYLHPQPGQEERHAPCPHCGSKWRYHNLEVCKYLKEKWGKGQ